MDSKIEYREQIKLAADYKSGLVKEIGSVSNVKNEYMSFEISCDESLIIYVESGSIFVYTDLQCQIICEKSTLIITNTSYCVVQYKAGVFTYIHLYEKCKGIKQDVVMIEPMYYQKSEYFIQSIWSSLTKYEEFDVYSLVSSVYRFYSDVSHISIYSRDKLVEDILSYIEINFTESLSLEKMAQVFGYSKYYLAHIFKLHMGLSLYDYILRRRLTNVKKLLIEDVYSIEKIAEMSGFTSDIALYRTFKKMYSVTP